jgi:MarR family transcriptional regulator, organic hydroperoxide resistance regulator
MAVGDRRRPTRGNADLASEIERLLTSGIGITVRAIDQTPEAAELTLVQWRVLVIASQTEGLRIGELAAHLGISIPSTSRLVRRIEAQGLVTAVRAEDDRRATNIALTRAGREIVGAVVRRRRGLIGRALSAEPEASMADAAPVVRQIADRLADFA